MARAPHALLLPPCRMHRGFFPHIHTAWAQTSPLIIPPTWVLFLPMNCTDAQCPTLPSAAQSQGPLLQHTVQVSNITSAPPSTVGYGVLPHLPHSTLRVVSSSRSRSREKESWNSGCCCWTKTAVVVRWEPRGHTLAPLWATSWTALA